MTSLKSHISNLLVLINYPWNSKRDEVEVILLIPRSMSLCQKGVFAKFPRYTRAALFNSHDTTLREKEVV
jgi:hypothetical protein